MGCRGRRRPTTNKNVFKLKRKASITDYVNMVLKRDLERTVSILEKHISKLRLWGLPAVVVYSNDMGALRTFGSPAITSIVDQHRQDIFARDDYQEVVMHENVTDQHLLLPIINPPLEQRNFQSTRSNANSVVKASSGTARVGWGDSDKTPNWC